MSQLKPNSAAQRIVETLIAHDVTMFFGIPGGPICPLFEAIRRTPQAKLVESRHESHAAFAAALYFRTTGKIPTLAITAGPGLTNAITGVASAFLENIPMLVIAGDVAWMTSGNRMAQDSGPEGIHAESLYKSITKAQIRINQSRNAVTHVLAALSLAKKPDNEGPVLCILPLDVSMGDCATASYVTTKNNESCLDDTSPIPTDCIKTIAQWLSAAQHPLIVIGGGCRGYQDQLTRLVDSAKIPFVTTPRAKGLVSEMHPYSLRNGGVAASLWARRYTAESVDVCLALGTDLDDLSTSPTRYLGQDGKLIHVDKDARIFNRSLPATLAINAKLETCIQQLLDSSYPLRGNDHAESALKKAKSSSPFNELEIAESPTSFIRPDQLILELEEATNGMQCRFITDIGEHTLFALHFLTAKKHDDFTIQLNLGSMASGIAGAIGLAIGDRTRPVICIAGDGGMHMAGMEALLAMKEHLPILFVVMNDSRYNMVHHGMRQIFGEAETYDMPPVDFQVWASSFSMPAVTVTSSGDITKKLVQKLLAHGGPALIDARINPNVRIKGGGRVEALQHMSMVAQQEKEAGK